MTMLKSSGFFPENWRRKHLEGVLSNKKDAWPHLFTLSLKAVEECQALSERGRLRKPCLQELPRVSWGGEVERPFRRLRMGGQSPNTRVLRVSREAGQGTSSSIGQWGGEKSGWTSKNISPFCLAFSVWSQWQFHEIKLLCSGLVYYHLHGWQ